MPHNTEPVAGQCIEHRAGYRFVLVIYVYYILIYLGRFVLLVSGRVAGEG